MAILRTIARLFVMYARNLVVKFVQVSVCATQMAVV